MKKRELACKRCNHKWIPRVKIVNECPHCQSISWNKKKAPPRGRERMMRLNRRTIERSQSILTKEETIILKMAFVKNMTYQSIGHEIEVSRGRVHQIIKRAYKKIRRNV